MRRNSLTSMKLSQAVHLAGAEALRADSSDKIRADCAPWHALLPALQQAAPLPSVCAAAALPSNAHVVETPPRMSAD